MTEKFVDELAEQNYAIIDNFLSQEEIDFYRSKIDSLYNDEQFKKAGIGAKEEQTIDKQVRTDYIFWLKNDLENAASAVIFSKIDTLREYIRTMCFLNIQDMEMHLTYYPEGSFYKRHLDQFKENDNRELTFICYLNENWKEQHEGKLRIYLPDGSCIDIAPISGRLVCFRSHLLEHEVLVTKKARYSITGWMLRMKRDLLFLI